MESMSCLYIREQRGERERDKCVQGLASMEEQLGSLAVTHLLQHTLRSLCVNGSSDWLYAVFWRILPRNYPPPKWDFNQIGGQFFDRMRGNRRNWILAWEDGFCNFSANICEYKSGEAMQVSGLQPETFFKMSHEIYNYGEGLIGKVASDQNHKWVFNEPQDKETNNPLSSNNPAEFYPRTWEAQFQSGIKTIALISVREGVIQLGSLKKVQDDLNYILVLRKNFSYIENIPGVLLPHPSSQLFPTTPEGFIPNIEFYEDQNARFTPSMSSLEALLSKLPPVGPTQSQSKPGVLTGQLDEMERIGGGESSGSMGYFVN